MTKSYRKDIQILMSILKNQNKILDTIHFFGCSQNDLDKNDKAFDLCAFYMAQIGESSKLLTDGTKESLSCLDVDILRLFRNMIDHTYEKVNKAYLKAYIFGITSPSAIEEIKDRIRYCKDNA